MVAIKLRSVPALALGVSFTLFSQFACSGSVSISPGSGGSGNGGTANGGTASGGAAAGGAAAGGAANSGGAPAGGASVGGSSAGGAASGGGASGGAASGGAPAGGGDGVGGTGTGGSANGGFQPCPATGECKVLPLGDSITFGLGFDGGYRVELFHLANEDDHQITFTGTQSPNGPAMVDGKTFPKKHAGISGQTIAQIASRVPSPDMTEVPHIVLIHAGTNDMYQTPAGAPDRLGDLIDKAIAAAPDALIVVSNIIPFPSGAAATTTFNAAVPAQVQQRADEGAHIVFVDQFKDFPTSELGDGVHPNQAGYGRMAAKWYAAIEEYLP